MNNLGIHIFEQHTQLDWEIELISFNLLSALSWKEFQGPIHLYCNTMFLETLKRWGVDTVYDYINVDILNNKPNNIDYKEFWAFSKILVLDHLKNSKEKFTLVDNDLWLRGPIDTNRNYDVVVYHRENFDLNYHNNVYTDFDDFTPETFRKLDFDKSILPTNCALLTINNCVFIEEWVDLCKSIANFNYNSEIKTNHKSTKMCFIEQRLLPMLLSKKELTLDTYLTTVYQSHLVEPQNGSEWYPRIENLPEKENLKFDNIKHVWGMKRLFHYAEIKKLVVESCLNSLSTYHMGDKPYFKLYTKLMESYSSPYPSPSFV